MTPQPRLLLLGMVTALAIGALVVEPAASPGRSRVPGVQGPPAGRGAPPKPMAPPEPERILEATDEDDRHTGGSGDDWIFGGKGDDTLRGGEGNDAIDGGEGDDVIDGGPGDDIIDAGPGADTVRGGTGDDTIDGHDDDDFIDGGNGADDIDGGDGNDTLIGGPGNDRIAGGDEHDTIRGDGGDDELSGDEGNDTVFGGAGDDRIYGGDDDDTLSGDTGNDRLDGGQGNDALRGGQGDDTLLGGLGDDSLHGGVGHDVLLGGDGIDALDGGLGHDWLTGGAGADVIHGGGGDDLVIVRAGDVPAGGFELIDGGSGDDRLILSGFAQVLVLEDGLRLTDPLTRGTYIISGIERVEYTQFIAQVDQASEHTLSLVLVNPGAAASEGRVIFFGADGAIVAPAGRAGQDQITFSVPARGSLRLEAVVRGPATAQVFSTTPLGAFAPGGLGVPNAAPLLATSLVDGAIVPVFMRVGDGADSGALILSTITDTQVKLTLYGTDGTELDSDLFPASGHVVVPAYGHRLVYARDVFRGLASLQDFQGTMTLEANVEGPREGSPIAVVGLHRSGPDRVITTAGIPIVPATPAPQVRIARVTAGTGAAQSIVLVNPADNRAQGTLRFFSDAGQPWDVAVNGQRAAASVPFDIQPRGMAVFTTASTGAPGSGTFHAEAAEGTVSAFVRAAGNAPLLLPSGQVVSGFISAVRQDRSRGMATTLSIASTGTAATATLRLRTNDGTDMPGGTAELAIPANGQVTRSLADIFPAAADGFDGTLAVETNGATVAVSLTEVAGIGAPPAALPVVPLP